MMETLLNLLAPSGPLFWFVVFFVAVVFGWGLCAFLRAQSLKNKPAKHPLDMDALSKPARHFLVTGGTGFVGKPLCTALLSAGHSVTLLTRDTGKASGLFTGNIRFITSLDALADDARFDSVINLAGEPISQRWTAGARTSIIESRTGTTKALLAFFNRAQHKPNSFISGSAIGIYGTDETTAFTEDTPASLDPLGAFPREVCAQWEAEARKAALLGIRTCLLRTGVVLETDGGALAQMLFPFDFGMGGAVGSGKQWFSWIHRDDLIRLIIHLVNDTSLEGAVNATAPTPVTNKVFSKSLGKAMQRPALLPLPAFQVKLLFGQMGQALLLAGQKVVPKKATESGFTFRHPTLDEALRAIFTR